MSDTSMKIDFVISWVDGSDPAHLAKRQDIEKASLRDHPESNAPTRFADSGEIYFAVASILKYAPFVNRIWIVADAQKPAHLDEFARQLGLDADRICVVDHKDIFKNYESALPTFSSLSIETMLWRIPGLAENFVYLNDDVFLNGPTQVEDFFENGKPVLYGTLVPPSHKRPRIVFRRTMRKLLGRPPNLRPSFRLAQEKAARMAGQNGKFWLIEHTPHPLRRSIFVDYFAEHQPELVEQISHRFRKLGQFVPVSLANTIEQLSHGVRVGPPPEMAYLGAKRDGDLTQFLHRLTRNDIKFGCVQSLDDGKPSTQRAVINAMRQKFQDQLPDAIDAQFESHLERALSLE